MDSSNGKFTSDSDDEVIDWSREAAGVIQDIRRHVKEAVISEKLPVTNSEAFINFRTLEDTELCVKLDGEGLQIVGDRFDSCDLESPVNMRYETPYSLLSSVSSSYVESFGNSLAEALSKKLQDQILEKGERLEDLEFESPD
ncbi:GSK3-beta interaction protein [Uranotaenia lowii]|uniref:GSK3-beta interaction protein n=1 Tax=Uranotaenia lowii TaxID=190385 RepID=UPI0024795FB1|nr:GSK3-beta interaction protein [Uranotaenia lowii]